jgi:hypothetical protein
MDYSGYISVAYQAEPRLINMTENDMMFLIQSGMLELQLDEDRFSVYKIYSEIKKSGIYTVAYKNVHKRVHKMLSLGLIEEVQSGGYILHGAKYYEISLNGWLNLFLRAQPWIKPVIEKYYNKNIIFKTFLYPYFELKTILFCLDYVDLCTYLGKCCQTTIEALKERQSSESIFAGDSVSQLSREGLDGLAGEKLRKAIEQKLELQRIEEQRLGNIEEYGRGTLKWMESWYPKSISRALDSYVKSFLFEQIAKASHFQANEITLSKDKKFMAAIEKVGVEFMESYDRLTELGQLNN